MESASFTELGKLCESLGAYRSSLVREKLVSLILNKNVIAVFTHGSFSRRLADDLSDLDLIVIAEDNAFDGIVESHHEALKRDRMIACHARTTRYSWFGTLEAAIFFGGKWFTFEVGFVRKSQLKQFFVEPDAWIIKDQNDVVEIRRKECISEQHRLQMEEEECLEFDLLNLALKFEKSIKRGHYWNASNYCNVARRLLFSIKRRQKYGAQRIFVGLPERRIESELGHEEILEINNAIPEYDASHLSSVFLDLFDAVLRNCKDNLDENSKNWLLCWRDQQK